MKHLFTLLLLANLALLGSPTLASSAQENPAIGHVTRAQGSATALTMTLIEPTARRLTIGKPLFAGDRLETQEGARLEVRLRDGVLVTLGEKSVFVLQSLAGQKNDNTVLELTKGVFRAVTPEGASQPAHLLVNTAVATIGIRGTEFW
ncbi:MAG: FecR family protein, partial [Pseudomonadota bacterium]